LLILLSNSIDVGDVFILKRIIFFIFIILALSFQVKAQIDNDDFTPSGIESFDEIEPVQIKNNDANGFGDQSRSIELSICKSSGEDCSDDNDCCDYIKDKSALCEVGSEDEDDVNYVCKKAILSENISCSSDNECLNGVCENSLCRILEGEVCRNTAECSKNLKCIKKGKESRCLSKESKLYAKSLNKKKNKKPNEKNYSARCGQVYQSCCSGSTACSGMDTLVCSSPDNKCKPCGYPGRDCCPGGGCRMPSLVSCTSSNVCSYCGGTNDPCCTDPSKPSCRYSSDTCDNGTCKNCGGLYANCCSDGMCMSGLSCDSADNKCKTCGFIDNLCCTAPGENPCNDNLACTDGKCKFCGYLNDPCCTTDPACMSGQCIDGKCQNCGNIGNSCCPGNVCQFGQCKDGTCQNCGFIGQPCCNGGACNSSNLQCVGGKCDLCGGQGQSCCPSGNACQVGNVCKSGRCESCGSNGSDCCPLPNPNNNPCNSSNSICDGNNKCVQCGLLVGQPCCTKQGQEPCLAGTCSNGICENTCALLGGSCHDTYRKCCPGRTCERACTGFFCSSVGRCCIPSSGECTNAGPCCKGLTCVKSEYSSMSYCGNPTPTPTPTPTATPTPTSTPNICAGLAGCQPNPGTCPAGTHPHSNISCCCGLVSCGENSNLSCAKPGYPCTNNLGVVGHCASWVPFLVPCSCDSTPLATPSPFQ
jgi:hypothetical protein